MMNAGNQTPLRFGRIGSAYEIKRGIDKSTCAHFGCIDFYNWADRPAGLSKAYRAGEIPPSSRFADGMDLIQDVMRDLDSMFLREYNSYNGEYLYKGFRKWFRDSLEDPGKLYYAVFWRIAKDPDAVSFEWHLFKGHRDICRNIIHGESYTLSGNPHTISSDVKDGWSSLIALHGAIAGENEIIKHEPPESFECLDLGIASSSSIRSSFYLFAITMQWPLLIKPDEVFDSVAKAQEYAVKLVADRNQESDNPKEIYVIDHAVLNNVTAWGVTHLRVFLKRTMLS